MRRMDQNIKNLTLNFNTIMAKKIVIMGSGPSILNHIKQIEICKQKKYIIIGTNREYPIQADYTVFGDYERLKKNYKEITSHSLIVPHDWYFGKNRTDRKKFLDAMDVKLFFFQRNTNILFKDIKKIKIDKNGFINHYAGGTGITSMILSCFFHPKEIIISGFDGPVFYENKTISKKYDGEIGHYRPDEWGPIKKREFLESKVIPFLVNKGIVVKCFEDDMLWSINKQKAGITTIK